MVSNKCFNQNQSIRVTHTSFYEIKNEKERNTTQNFSNFVKYNRYRWNGYRSRCAGMHIYIGIRAIIHLLARNFT